MIEKYLRKIQDAGYTAVVYTQDVNVKNTKRSLAGIYSPGTYFQTETPHLTNSITCIWIHLVENKSLLKGIPKGKYVMVGIANIDIYTGKTSIFEFSEQYINSPTTYDELERFISIYNPSEVIIIANFPDEEELDYVISYAGISCDLIHKICINNKNQLNQNSDKMKRIANCEKQTYQKEILSKFYTFDNFHIFIQNFYQNSIATQAFCYLLDFVYQHNPHLVKKISEPVFENYSTRLSLSNHTLKQLNIIEDGNTSRSKLSSVSYLLNNCLTPMGRRKFLYNILNPTCDEDALKREYNITEYVLNNIEQFSFLKTKLTQIKDLAKFERQIFLKKINPKSIYILYQSMLHIRETFQSILEYKEIIIYLQHFHPNIKEISNLCDELIEFITKTIDLELCKDVDNLQMFETNFIKSGINADLDKKQKILTDSEETLQAIRKYLSNLIETRDKKTEKSTEFVKIHETEKNNCGLVCTSRRCKILHDMLPISESTISLETNSIPFIFNITKSNFTFEKQSSTYNFIIHSQINQLSRNILECKGSMKDLITNNYNQFIENIGIKFQDKLEKCIQFITLMDMIYTKAVIAKTYNYCKPEIMVADKSFVNAKGLRHCLIEQFHKNEIYVSNNICLGTDKMDGILLYGTNAVGKTTLIRSLGIAIILAQAGLYVPCTTFEYKPYKRIFTRIIGNDNIFKGLSTFEVEMSELRTILRLMDKDSLILGDELCSGTETISAISIFVAGIQKLYQAKSSFIFATHLHEIVNYEEITQLDTLHLKHMEVKYDKENDVLIYDRKIRDGSGTKMYGLEVCKSLKLPMDFLELANEIRLKYNPEDRSILTLKQSRYNSNKLISICEKCGKNMGTEVHHLQYQSDADQNNMIKTEDGVFHKNNLANLMTLCESCHTEIHKKNVKQKRVKTNKSDIIIEL
jgi:DNA mismatch repair protein MutS